MYMPYFAKNFNFAAKSYQNLLFCQSISIVWQRLWVGTNLAYPFLYRKTCLVRQRNKACLNMRINNF